MASHLRSACTATSSSSSRTIAFSFEHTNLRSDSPCSCSHSDNSTWSRRNHIKNATSSRRTRRNVELFGTPVVFRKMRRSRRGGALQAKMTAEDEYTDLPLFPLPLVLFPGGVLPLQIFEYRYRIMMHTLMQTDMRFGVVFAGGNNGTAAAIGSVAEVVKHEKYPDDRFALICQGQQRFRVVDIVRTKPYLVGKVQWLEDKPGATGRDDTESLAKEVENLMKDVIRLSNKVAGKPARENSEDLRKNAFPTPFSFWVASTFEGAPLEQQSLLELEDTAERLRRERDTLRNTLNYLTAATAVKDAFSGGGSSGASK